MAASVVSSSIFPAYPFLHKNRLLYLAFCAVAGIYAGLGHAPSPWPTLIWDSILWGTIGLTIGCTALWMETQLTKFSQSTLIGGSLGLIMGMAGTGLLLLGMGFGVPQIIVPGTWTMLPAFLLGPYLGMAIGIHIFKLLSRGPRAEFPTDYPPQLSHTASHSVQKLLDSSAIIDGRVLALCTTGFLEGPFLVPQCILHELQTLADSGQLSRRTKGKRGLEILSQFQQLPNAEVKVIDDWEPAISEVDHQLIAIAKKREAHIVTNDWNLAKIASLQGVCTLNVNELTYQLRPLVLPGETIRVFIHKEGQGHGQGIAHLDDGTMVVVDHGSTLVGQAVEVIVTRFMQTNTGRMIFSSPHDLVEMMKEA
jgi:uncharacterized protein YacL